MHGVHGVDEVVLSGLMSLDLGVWMVMVRRWSVWYHVISMHRPMHSPACLSTKINIEPQLANTEQDYMNCCYLLNLIAIYLGLTKE